MVVLLCSVSPGGGRTGTSPQLHNGTGRGGSACHRLTAATPSPGPSPPPWRSRRHPGPPPCCSGAGWLQWQPPYALANICVLDRSMSDASLMRGELPMCSCKPPLNRSPLGLLFGLLVENRVGGFYWGGGHYSGGGYVRACMRAPARPRVCVRPLWVC